MCEKNNTTEKKISVRRLNRILNILLNDMKNLTDEGRDFPIRWYIMHMYSSSQIAKILALKRGLDLELMGIAAALHDIGAVMTKKHKDHAINSEKYVKEFIERYNRESKLQIITEEEMNKIVKAIVQHSEKDKDSNDPFVETLKDVDSLDRYLHGVKTEGYYLKRCEKLIRELFNKDLLSVLSKINY